MNVIQERGDHLRGFRSQGIKSLRILSGRLGAGRLLPTGLHIHCYFWKEKFLFLLCGFKWEVLGPRRVCARLLRLRTCHPLSELQKAAGVATERAAQLELPEQEHPLLCSHPLSPSAQPWGSCARALHLDRRTNGNFLFCHGVLGSASNQIFLGVIGSVQWSRACGWINGRKSIPLCSCLHEGKCSAPAQGSQCLWKSCWCHCPCSQQGQASPCAPSSPGRGSELTAALGEGARAAQALW